jgi:uncharacterized damage-inducible protein DinB
MAVQGLPIKSAMTKRIVLLQALASTVPDISRVMRNLGDTTENWRPNPREWSCREILAHLNFVEEAYLSRMRRVLTEKEPQVPAIHLLEFHDTSGSMEELIQSFRNSREVTLVFLQGVSPAGWQRTAIHETKGRLSLRYLVQDLVNHDIEHTNQLVETIGKWRKQSDQYKVRAD